MTQTQPTDTDVLVVGAGPTGLVLGSELLRRGLRCRVVDRQDSYPTSTRGHALQPRTLEILDLMGIAGPMLAIGANGYRTEFLSGRQLAFELNTAFAPRPDAPYLSQLLARQPRIEGVLRDHLGSQGGVVERQCELVDLRQDDEGVVATLHHADTDRSEPVRASYLVGCDGGRSQVRGLLGLTFEGETVPEHFVLADAELDWDLDPAPDLVYWWLHEDGLLLASTYGAAPTWNLFAQIRANPAGEVEPASEALLERLIAQRTGLANVRLSHVNWLSNYSINRRLVNHYRVGRAFVAGDAAHIHSPAGGQGMNTGIQDGFNLGWKLALVVKGQAPDTLLDTYEQERLPVARAVVGGSNTRDASLYSNNPVMSFIRGRVAGPLLNQPAVREALFYRLAQLNINYRGSALAQEVESPLGSIALAPMHHVEAPGLKDWFEFHAGPRAGDRAPQAHGQCASSGAPASLFEIFRTGKHSLLLFGGLGQTAEGYAGLAQIAGGASRAAGTEVQTYLIVAGSDQPPALDWSGTILLDPAHEMHKTYGAGANSLYLIRPDGYVGFRSQPADQEALLNYLSQWFTPDGLRQPFPVDR